MKTISIILVFALLALAVNAGKFKQRHGELRGLQSLFGKLDSRLRKQIKSARNAIGSSRRRRNKHHLARKRAHSKLRSATRKRVRAEAVYNSRRKYEEKKLRSFKVAHKVYLSSKANYKRVYRRESKNIKNWDHERSVIERIRKLLGVNHSKSWLRYKKEKAIKFYGRGHRNHKKVGTHFNKNRKRFMTKVRARRAVITGTSDDKIRLFINGRYMGNRKNMNGWGKASTWVTKLKKGDKIQVHSVNAGKYHGGNNPGGLRLQIRYGRRTFYTNRSWRCISHRRRWLRRSRRSIRRLPRARLHTFKWNSHHKVKGMSSKAKWIWTRNFATKRVDCFFVIPY